MTTAKDGKEINQAHGIIEAVMRHCYEDAALLAYSFKETDLDPRGSWRENIAAAIRARGVEMGNTYARESAAAV